MASSGKPTKFNVQYTPQIADCHLIYFRVIIGDNPPSAGCTYLDETTSVVGVPKSVLIDLADYIDQGDCLNGYNVSKCNVFTIEYSVIPCCGEKPKEYSNSIENSPSCTTWEITCTGPTCNEFNFTDCLGNSSGNLQLLNSHTIYVCSKVAPTQVAGANSPLTIAEYNINGCCFCTNFSIENLFAGTLTYYYINCDGVFSIGTVEENSTETICAEGFPFVLNPNNATITPLGPCPE